MALPTLPNHATPRLPLAIAPTADLAAPSSRHASTASKTGSGGRGRSPSPSPFPHSIPSPSPGSLRGVGETDFTAPACDSHGDGGLEVGGMGDKDSRRCGVDSAGSGMEGGGSGGGGGERSRYASRGEQICRDLSFESRGRTEDPGEADLRRGYSGGEDEDACLPALPVGRVREVGEDGGKIRGSSQGAEMGGHAGSDSIRCAAAKHLVLAAAVDSRLSSAGVQVSTPPGSPVACRRGSDAKSRRASPPPMLLCSPVKRVVGRRATARRALQVSVQLSADPACPVPKPAGGVVAPLQKAPPLPDPHQEGPGRGEARVRPTPSSFFISNLVWVRKDKFTSGEFTEADCHPVGKSDRLSAPKSFSFSRDYWARKSGKIPFASIVKMAGGGRDASNRGGRYGSGRGRNGRPPAPTPSGQDGTAPPQLVPQAPQAAPLHMSIYTKPSLFPVGSAQAIMQAGGRCMAIRGLESSDAADATVGESAVVPLPVCASYSGFSSTIQSLDAAGSVWRQWIIYWRKCAEQPAGI
ncbi:uncharacterized protein [Triticum aestivum]|uniref:uncharacterized protein n=1 Tax=Triticum aestivum TaxID=4565 RepID=UPI001D023BA1|nr:uncharacterized protein LOC123104548 [Triticum aestivum]